MITLSSSSEKLRIVSVGSNATDVQVSYATDDGTTVTGGSQETAIATSATTDICAAPSGSNKRSVTSITIRNKATPGNSEGITVQKYNGSTATELIAITSLNGGSTLAYEDGRGWYIITGAPTTVDTIRRVSSDSVHATAATFADVTDLQVALQSGKNYAFEAHLFHISNATTTGAQFAVNIGAAPTNLIVGNYSGVTNSVTAGAFSLGTATARDTAITAQTTGSANVTHTIIGGFITPSADGTFSIRATSEVTVAAGLTIKAGSWLWLREVDN